MKKYDLYCWNQYGWFEREFIFKPVKNKLVLWLKKKYCRLMREIFCSFQGNEEELKKIVNLLNAFKNNLQFTYEYNKEILHFFDM